MQCTYSVTDDAHYCACGCVAEWVDDPRHEGMYGLRCEACGRVYWDADDAS